jgi:hypothetical protein
VSQLLRHGGPLRAVVAMTTSAAILAACGSGEDDLDGVEGPGRREMVDTETTEDPAVQRHLDLLESHPGVVAGVVEVWSATGRLLATRSVPATTTLPHNLAALMDSGEPDEQGYVYSDVAGAAGDGTYETRYQYVKRTFDPDAAPASPFQESPPIPSDLASEEYLSVHELEVGPDEVEIYVRLREPFTTPLNLSGAKAIASLAGVESAFDERRATIDARKSEANALQERARQALEELGAGEIGGFWTSNALSAWVPRSAMVEVLQIPDVVHVELVHHGSPESSTQWDGADMKAGGGLNAGAYHDSGYHGQAYLDMASGRHMRVGMIGTLGWYDHAGFKDSGSLGSASRAHVYDCVSSPCVADQSAASGVDGHDLKCGGLAAGSIRQDQLSGYTSTEQLQRSGVAEEVELYFLEGHGSTSTKRAIELAIELEIDVLFASRGWGDDCSGQVPSGVANLEQSVMAAQAANTIVMKSAGNDGNGGGCTVTYPGDTPSVFVVGGLGSDTNTCTSGNYTTCALNTASSRGGVDATIGGSTWTAALTAVDVMAPACPQYYYKATSPWIHTYDADTVCGTSYAVPQVAGAAALVKDYFLANGYGSITIEGRPFVVLLAMSDRQASVGRSTTGFDPVWGGGRFQMRRFDASDHTGVWGWETYSHVFNGTGTSDHILWGTNAEPASLAQVKVYSMHFETDAVNMANVNLQLRSSNCTGLTLSADSSGDVKKMVRLGTSGAGHQLCARLNAVNFPTLGAPRRVHVFAYHSAETAMR